MAQIPAGIVAVAVTTVFAIALSVPLMRLSGISAALSMFAVLLIVNNVANNWDAVTRGRQTMFGIPPNTGLGSALVGALLAIVVAYAFQQSRYGLLMRSAREDEVAAQAIGVDVVRERRIAFVLSAMVVATGGFLYAQFLTSFNPDAFYVNITFLTIAMLVVGGVNSLAGAVVGTVVVTVVAEVLRNVEDGTTIGPLDIPGRPGLRETGLAAAMLLILIFRPKGLTGGHEVPPLSAVRLRRHRSEPTVPTPIVPSRD